MIVSIRTQPCMVCDEVSIVKVDDADYGAWVSGVFIQDAFPNLSAGERELLMTGTHDECWDEMFTDEEKW